MTAGSLTQHVQPLDDVVDAADNRRSRLVLVFLTLFPVLIGRTLKQSVDLSECQPPSGYQILPEIEGQI